MKNLPKDPSKEELQSIAALLVEKMQKEGESLKEVLEVKDSYLEEIYSLAYANYSQGKYSTSTSLFFFLTGVDDHNFKYMYGLASSFYQEKNYEKASVAYLNALLLNQDDPHPAYYLADCFAHLGNAESAMEFYDIAIEISGDNPKHKALKDKCLLLRKSLVSNNK